MEDLPYYSRRLTSNELSLWMNLHQDDMPIDDPVSAQSYMDLEETMFFIAYLGDDVAGASTIFRDTARMSILLSAVRIPERNRSRLTKHIIKTSLPFFKSVSIREADALVNPSLNKDSIPFALYADLGSWTEEALVENGFGLVGTFIRANYSISESDKFMTSTEWDTVPASIDSVKGLFWKLSPEEKPDHAQFWLGLHQARDSGTYYSLSGNSNLMISLGAQSWKETLLITSLMYDTSTVAHKRVAEELVSLLKKKGLSSVSINMLPEHSELMDSMCDFIGEPTSTISLKLYRKSL